jgi:hypothetical protein
MGPLPQDVPTDVNTALKAGVVYGVLAFAIGFCLGVIRVVAVAPRLGETAAVGLEVPVMLAFSWLLSRRCVRRFKVPPGTASRLMMGKAAFALLMSAELGVSVIALGRSVAEHLAGYRSIPGAVGLAAQVAFAVLPAIQGRAEPG